MLRNRHYIEPNDASAPFPFDFEPAYREVGGNAVAWSVDAYEAEADKDYEWSGILNPTGRLLAHMIGDDRTFEFDPDELEPIADEDYCAGCGQIGCGWC